MSRAMRRLPWAPDSSRIAYVADQDTDEIDELYTSLPDGSNNVKVNGTLVSEGNVYVDGEDSFAWAPDSSRIAYVASQDSSSKDELYTSLPDGSNNVKVNGTLVASGDVEGFRWAPDSSRIVYYADQDTNGTDEIYTSEPDGSNNVKVNGTLVASGDVEEFPLGTRQFQDRLCCRPGFV